MPQTKIKRSKKSTLPYTQERISPALDSRKGRLSTRLTELENDFHTYAKKMQGLTNKAKNELHV
jgi:hypothetical protein